MEEVVFTDWTVKECIGNGAFGKVYRIEREDFGTIYQAALKVIDIPQNTSELESVRSESMTQEDVTSYFYAMVQEIVQEISLMVKIKGNSHIVSYEDHMVVEKKDEFGWRIYIRMELLTPLLTKVQSEEMSRQDVIQLGIDICKALEVCQKYQIIHRDIKPENIFVSDIGAYKLGDFGIARQLEKTTYGLSRKGTILYMAPEVYLGREYNHTVDIYSLGVVLYRYMNDNRLPFLPDASKTITYGDKEKANQFRLSGQRLKPPCHAEPELARIILKACEYNPHERYQSVQEMREDLEKLLSKRDIGVKEEHSKDNETLELTLQQESTLGEGKKVATKSDHIVLQVSDQKRRSGFSVKMLVASLVCLVMIGVVVVFAVKGIRFNHQTQEKHVANVETKQNVKEIAVTQTPEPVTPMPAKESPTKNTQCIVQDYTGLTYSTALKRAEKRGLRVRKKTAYSITVKKGKVIKQSIKEGKVVKVGKTIVLTVSKGKKATPTPRPTQKPAGNNSSSNHSKKNNSNNKMDVSGL